MLTTGRKVPVPASSDTPTCTLQNVRLAHQYLPTRCAEDVQVGQLAVAHRQCSMTNPRHPTPPTRCAKDGQAGQLVVACDARPDMTTVRRAIPPRVPAVQKLCR